MLKERADALHNRQGTECTDTYRRTQTYVHKFLDCRDADRARRATLQNTQHIMLKERADALRNRQGTECTDTHRRTQTYVQKFLDSRDAYMYTRTHI